MDIPLPPILETKLADFRRRVWIVKLAEGVLAAAFALAVSYLLVFALDRVMETPGWLRGTLLLGGALVLGLGLPLKWHRWGVAAAAAGGRRAAAAPDVSRAWATSCSASSNWPGRTTPPQAAANG